MANVVRANREFDQRAVFGLGDENQAEDLFDSGGDGLAVGGATVRNTGYYNEAEVFFYTSTTSLATYLDASDAVSAFDGSDASSDINSALYARTDYAPQVLVNDWPEVVGGILEADVLTGGTFDGTDGTAAGAYLHGYYDGTAGFATVSGAYALGFVAGRDGVTATGNIDHLSGIRAQIAISNYSGTVASAYGAYVRPGPHAAATATITNNYGVAIIAASGAATITNNYGLHIADQSGEGSVVSRNIFSAGATAINEFQGPVRMGAALDHDGSTAGFYGTAPIAKQTGVAVDAAAIHAALVALGLIGA